MIPALAIVIVAPFIDAAHAQSGQCQARLDTWADFRPDASSHTWIDPGGWNKKRLASFPDHRVAQAELEKSAFKRYPALIQEQLLEGELPLDVVGLDEVALKLAWGEPDFVWGLDGRGCQALLFGERSPPVVFDSCDGELLRMHTLSEPIPCARLDAVSDRLGRSTFDGLDRRQALQLIAGVPDTWMDVDDLETAFGKPLDKKRNQRTYADARGIQEEVTVQVGEADFAVSWQWAPGAGGGRTMAIASTHVMGEPFTKASVSTSADDPMTSTTTTTTSSSTTTLTDDPTSSTSTDGPTTAADDSTERRPAPAPVPEPEPEPEPEGHGVAVSQLPSQPPADLADARHRYTGACGQQDIEAKLDVGGDGYRMSIRMAGEQEGALAIYRTSGRIRGSDDALSFDGLGSGTLSDGQLVVTLGPWPLASCSGAVLTPAP